MKMLNIDSVGIVTAREGIFIPDSKIIKLGPRIEVRTDKRFEKGRTRLNCTMPTKNNRWRWYGRQFVVH